MKTCSWSANSSRWFIHERADRVTGSVSDSAFNLSSAPSQTREPSKPAPFHAALSWTAYAYGNETPETHPERKRSFQKKPGSKVWAKVNTHSGYHRTHSNLDRDQLECLHDEQCQPSIVLLAELKAQQHWVALTFTGGMWEGANKSWEHYITNKFERNPVWTWALQYKPPQDKT